MLDQVGRDLPDFSRVASENGLGERHEGRGVRIPGFPKEAYAVLRVPLPGEKLEGLVPCGEIRLRLIPLQRRIKRFKER